MPETRNEHKMEKNYSKLIKDLSLRVQNLEDKAAETATNAEEELQRVKNKPSDMSTKNNPETQQQILKDISRRLRALEAKNFVDTEPVSKKTENAASILAEIDISIVGLKEALTWGHKPLQVVWIILLLLGAAGTIFYIYQNTQDYINSDTATKVTLSRQTRYEYPPIVLCPPWWFNAQAVLATGIPLDAFKYSLGYLTTDPAPDLEIENATTAQRDFLEYYKTKNFTRLADYFQAIAADMSETSSASYVEFDCRDCNNAISIEKKSYRTAICYVFRLNSAKYSPINDPPRIYVSNKDKTQGILSSVNKNWRMDLLPNVGVSGPSLKLAPFFPYMATISMQRVITINTPSSPCEDVSVQDYTQNSCVAPCFDDLSVKFGLGRNLESATPTEVLNMNKPDDDDQSGNNDFLNIFLNSTLFHEMADQCAQKCKPLCDSFTYALTLNRDVDKIVKSENEENNTSTIILEFKHSGIVQGGIFVWEEIVTTTFSGFLSNVGGTFGLFLGCTTMTLAQLILSVINYTLNNRKPTSRSCDLSTSMRMT